MIKFIQLSIINYQINRSFEPQKLFDIFFNLMAKPNEDSLGVKDHAEDEGLNFSLNRLEHSHNLSN